MAITQTTKEKLKRVPHIIAGFTILSHAYEKYETGHNSYLLFAISGIIFLTLAIFHHPIAKKIPWVDAVFFLIEGALSLVIANEFFHLGKKGLPIVYLVSGILQISLAIWTSSRSFRAQK